MHAQHGTIVRHIELIISVGTAVGMTDEELVDRFMARCGPRGNV